MSTYISEDEEAVLIKEIGKVITDLSTSNSEFERELAGLREENKELKITVETVLKESMERNIVIRGLPDSATETGQKLLQSVKKLIVTITKKRGIKIDTVQRIGQFELGFTRQVRVIFCTIRDRNAVFNCRGNAPIQLVFDVDTVVPSLRDVDEGCQVEADGIKFHKKFELALSDIVIDTTRVLGNGHFGPVFVGTVEGVEVAIKQSKESSGSLKMLLTSVKLHSYLGGHPNIVELIGAYIKDLQKGTLLVAYELCAKGTLEQYLRQKSQVSNNPNGVNVLLTLYSQTETVDFFDLLRFTLEISKALDHIERMNAIHGDVATRNVFLNSNLTCKLGDFGLSRRVYDYATYVKTTQEPLPWRWMAPESLTRMEFSSKSDMWSFGVAVWEIFSLGATPYGELRWTASFADDLRKGLRPSMPQFATEEIYNKLKECWNLEKDLRPSITEMVEFFTPLGNRAKLTEDYVNI